MLASLARHLRNNLTAVESGAPETRYTAWDDAYCVWNGGLKDLATRAQAAVWVAPGDPIVADIDAAFAAGHDAIGGEGASTAIDDWRVPPAKQIIEKTLFRAAQRDIVNLAVGAKTAGDPAMAALALGEFGIVRDRLEGRNTPGIAVIEGMLAGEPAMISGELIAIEMDKAFAKRTYNYAGMPADGLGVPTSYKSAVEGRTYAKLIAAGIAAAMMPLVHFRRAGAHRQRRGGGDGGQPAAARRDLQLPEGARHRHVHRQRRRSRAVTRSAALAVSAGRRSR
jgi:hypothetical protein